MPEITILGIGNPLWKDDGIGPRIVEELLKSGLPAGVEAYNAGGSFYHYWDAFAACRHIIALDALQGGHAPGTLYLLKPEEMLPRAPVLLKHEDDFLSVVEIMKFFGLSPAVTILGVEPKEITLGYGLSPEILSILPRVIQKIRDLCDQLLYPDKLNKNLSKLENLS
ncbi:hydrogenase maturation protease [Desulforamulus ruminis]|uniref:Hydrogenase maturation protease n=1 Tax=Desulforamulus ruminis (strain ATCC 23193 / DSM 2154 / NCIMB 8452 / DL) TaxID=696281 RepID=F6DME4_DESRL|nr:hydrogenase maturation protease [Desulforamulus ruminis DSM 2154]